MLLIMTAAVTVLLAVVMAMKMTQVLINPIRRLTQVARRISEGEYGARISLGTHDELGELGNTLNTLSARLSNVIERLREERDKLELIISSIGEGIIAVDGNFEVTHKNQAFLELMELSDEELAPLEGTEALAALHALLEECMRTGARCKASWDNPSQRKIAATASPLFGERGANIGAVCLIQDVSEAERLEQLRRDYVANISHELRTPLTGIRGMVEPLMDGYIDTEEEKADCYRIIYQETLRLEKLVREMLDMSRLQDGRVTLEMEELELPGIIDAAVRRMKNMADEAKVDLTADTGGARLRCIGNEDRILQVLIIFIDNALSFTPSGGRVTVYAREEKGRVRVGVVDTGVGIEPKDLPFIWERFYKADKSRMRTSGTGLGLAVAKLVVELMGGEIGVNTKVGEGSEFFFTLKKRVEEGEVEHEESDLPASGADASDGAAGDGRTDRRPGGRRALAAAGGEMLEQIRALMGDETFVTASGANGEVAAQIAAWEEAMDGQPLYTRVYDYPQLDRTLAYMNDGAEAPELSDAARAYFQPLTVQILCSQASAQRGALYLAASNVLRAGGYYALPEGFEDCVVVYDFGDVAFAVSMRRETVVDQEIMIAQGCVCAPEVREMLEGIAALEESGERALDLRSTEICTMRNPPL